MSCIYYGLIVTHVFNWYNKVRLRYGLQRRNCEKKKISTWIQGTETAHPPTIGVLCHNPPNTLFSDTLVCSTKSPRVICLWSNYVKLIIDRLIKLLNIKGQWLLKK